MQGINRLPTAAKVAVPTVALGLTAPEAYFAYRRANRVAGLVDDYNHPEKDIEKYLEMESNSEVTDQPTVEKEKNLVEKAFDALKDDTGGLKDLVNKEEVYENRQELPEDPTLDDGFTNFYPNKLQNPDALKPTLKDLAKEFMKKPITDGSLGHDVSFLPNPNLLRAD